MANVTSARSTDGAGSRAAGGRRWWALGALGLCVLVLNFDMTILNVALATLARDLHTSTGQLQWIVAAYSLTSAAFLLAAGTLGDRWGRKRTLLTGLTLFAVASVVAAWAPDTGTLIAMRAVMGMGAAVVMPMSLSIIPTLFGPRERGKAIALWSSTVVLGMPLGPIIGGTLLDHFWWGSIFLINVITVLLVVPLVCKLVPESRDPRPAALNPLGIVLSAAGVAALVYGLIDAEQGWTHPSALGWMGAGVVLLGVFIAMQRRSARPVVDLSLFRRPSFTWPMVLMVLVNFSALGLLFVTPLYLQGVRGLDAFETGLRLVSFALLALAGGVLNDRLVTRLGAKAVMVTGTLLLAGGLLLLAFATPSSGDGLVTVALGLVGGGIGLAQPPAMTFAVGALDTAQAGSGSAVIQSFRQIGGVFGVAVIGATVQTLYTGGLPDSVDRLPGPAAETVRSSVTGVAGVAERIGGPAGAALRDAAYTAFTHGMGVVLPVCAGIAVLTLLLTVVFLPRRRTEATEPDGR